MTNAFFGAMYAFLFRQRCDTIITPSGLMKSSFVRGHSELEMKIRCTSNDLRVEFTEPLSGTGCIDETTDPMRYEKMIETIDATCLPDDIYQTAINETIVHVIGGRARLFLADPADLILSNDFGYERMAPRMQAMLEDDVRKYAYNPAVYVMIGIHPYGEFFRLLERASSVLASYADNGFYIGDSRFTEKEVLGFDPSISRGVFLYENRNLILVGPAERHSDGNVYPRCFLPKSVPKFTVQLPAECPICFSNMTTRRNCETLKCGHIYHRRCMQEWRDRCTNGREVTCPNCRTVVS